MSIRTYIKSKINWFFDSFHTKLEPSSRKLTAFGFMLCVFFLHLNYVDMKNSIQFLITDCLTILLLYGIIHASDIIAFVKGKQDDKPTDPPKQEGV